MKLDLYIIGVGGQGIGVLSELIIRAYYYAGFSVRGVDTHGLAQRGGTVESHVRVGSPAGSPLIEKGCADAVLALERTEALRAMSLMLKDGGGLSYYDTSWQTLNVRLGKESPVQNNTISTLAAERGIKLLRVAAESSSDVRTQNITLLAAAVSSEMLPGLTGAYLEKALTDLFSGEILEMNKDKLHKQTK